MKKFLTLLLVALSANIFSLAAFAEESYPNIQDAFEMEEADDAPPSLQLDTGSSGSSGSSSSGSYVKTTTTPPPPAPVAPAQTPAPVADREISDTGPEMIYLIILGLLLIGGYQFAMKRK